MCIMYDLKTLNHDNILMVFLYKKKIINAIYLVLVKKIYYIINREKVYNHLTYWEPRATLICYDFARCIYKK